jgi:hypothetical protein
MDFTMYYRADASQEQQIDRIIETFDRPQYSPKPVDFPFSRRWLRSGAVYEPDYQDNWEKYGLSIVADVVKERYAGQLPDHFRGVVMEIDEGCQSVRFAFGRYPDRVWRCDHFTNTQYASRGFQTHLDLVERLLELGPLVDHLRVVDASDYWHTGNAEEARRRYNESRQLPTSCAERPRGTTPEALAPGLPSHDLVARRLRAMQADPDA